MGIHRQAWLAILITALVLVLLNIHPWQPGIGGRTDRKSGVQPDGSELELYYGWPACYRAELLRSDDPGMGTRVLRTAPFYFPPYAEGWVSSRYVGIGAIVLDVSFGLLFLVLVAVIADYVRRERWTRWAAITALTIVALLVAVYWLADRVEVYL